MTTTTNSYTHTNNCKMCRKEGALSNGYCIRCDDVLYGKNVEKFNYNQNRR